MAKVITTELQHSGASSANITLASDGDVGIGTSSPASIVHIENSAPVITAVATNNSSGLRLNVTGQSSGEILRLQEDGNEKFRFAVNGALGIGGANFGTSGQVLTSGGSGAAPSWAAIPASSGPAFRATQNDSTNQGLVGDTAATVAFDEETFDTDSCFDTSTYKFTPNKAGYYQVNYHVGFSASNNATSAWVYLQKNDAAYSQISQSNDWCYHMDMTSSDIVYLNGSSDSIRIRALHNSSGDTFTLFNGTTVGCYFSAFWIRT